jgi:hypothetical protein
LSGKKWFVKALVLVLKDVDLMIRLTKAVINSTHLPNGKTRLWDDN